MRAEGSERPGQAPTGRRTLLALGRHSTRLWVEMDRMDFEADAPGRVLRKGHEGNTPPRSRVYVGAGARESA